MLDAEHRRRLVMGIYDAFGRPETTGDALEEVFAPAARHHGSGEALDDGPAGARRLYAELRARLPGVVATVKRTVADGDVVAVHWHASADRYDEFSGESWCEFFRFGGDRVVDHWALHVAVPASTVSGRSVFSDAYGLVDGSRPAGTDAAAANLQVASMAFDRFLQFDPTVVADHWGAVYLQHNESIPDGTDALRESLLEVGSLPREVRPHFTVLVTVAEGDLVWFLEEVRVGGMTGLGVDIFRLAGRKIVEHWDVPALRPGAVAAGA